MLELMVFQKYSINKAWFVVYCNKSAGPQRQRRLYSACSEPAQLIGIILFINTIAAGFQARCLLAQPMHIEVIEMKNDDDQGGVQDGYYKV